MEIEHENNDCKGQIYIVQLLLLVSKSSTTSQRQDQMQHRTSCDVELLRGLVVCPVRAIRAISA